VADEIKQKISLEGEKEYSAALKEANRNLKTLRSELKAETAELGNNASAQQKNEAKSRSLRKQIEQQEKVVETLKSALKDAKERYGDNSEEVSKWEQKLNGARYTLATMNNQLEQSEAALKEQSDALKDSAGSYDDAAGAASNYADAVDSAGAAADAVTFQSVMTAADNLTGKLQNAMKFIMDLGKAAWEWMSDSGEWADTLTTDATKWGVDRQTLQGWRYAARFVDTEVETIARAFTKLTNRSDSTNKKLKEIGVVASKDVKGQDLFWDVIDAMSRLDDAARENAAMDIFGKSYQELLPLINAGRDAWEGYVEEAEKSGYVLDEDQIDKLGALDDANQKLQASFEAMQHTIAAELAPAFTQVSTAMSGLIDSFTEWAKTEEGQKTLHDLGDALKGLVDQFTGEKDFTGLVEGAADAVKKLTDALNWISEHKDIVIAGFGGVAAAIAGIKVSQTFLSALQLIKGIKWSALPKGTPSTPTTTPTGTPTAPVMPTPSAPVAAAGAKTTPTFFNSALPAFGTMIAMGASFVELMRRAGEYRVNNPDARGSESALERSTNGNDQLGQAFIDFVNANKELDELLNSPEYTDEKANALMDAVEEAQTVFESMEGHENVWDAYQAWLANNSNGAMSWELPAEIPAGWFGDVLDSMTWEDTGSLTSDDVSGFAALPADIEDAVAAGIATGTSGMYINMDGVTVGRVVAPYVSQEIAFGIP